MNQHLSWESLNDLVDGALVGAAADRARAHVAGCPQCAQQLATVRGAIEEVQALPPRITAPPELWQRVQATIEAGKIQALPGARRASWFRQITPRSAAAAAVALVVISSAATVLVMRGLEPDASPVVATTTAVPVIPASWQSAESGYLRTVEELRGQLEAQRGVLTVETVQSLERLLGTIDAAIAEARTVLLRDPANAALAELLASNYRQKIELLRRATRIAEST